MYFNRRLRIHKGVHLFGWGPEAWEHSLYGSCMFARQCRSFSLSFWFMCHGAWPLHVAKASVPTSVLQVWSLTCISDRWCHCCSAVVLRAQDACCWVALVLYTHDFAGWLVSAWVRSLFCSNQPLVEPVCDHIAFEMAPGSVLVPPSHRGGSAGDGADEPHVMAFAPLAEEFVNAGIVAMPPDEERKRNRFGVANLAKVCFAIDLSIAVVAVTPRDDFLRLCCSSVRVAPGPRGSQMSNKRWVLTRHVWALS